MENKKKALGKGLEQLFQNNSVIDFNSFEENIVNENKKDVTMISLSEIRSNPYQPRKKFNDESLNELAKSIKEYGIVQPIIVKKSIKGYEIVAGERRCRAAKIAGLIEVPAIIKDFSDQEMMEIALIENIQREDLNPIDEAKSVQNIINLRGLTQEEFAEKFGKSRTYITNLLGLLNLPNNIQNMLIEKQISPSHARVLSKMGDEAQINELAKRVVEENLNVRDLELLVGNEDIEKRKPIARESRNPLFNIYERTISDLVGNKVKIGKNKLEISFNSIEDLERIMELFNISVGDDD